MENRDYDSMSRAELKAERKRLEAALEKRRLLHVQIPADSVVISFDDEAVEQRFDEADNPEGSAPTVGARLTVKRGTEFVCYDMLIGMSLSLARKLMRGQS